MDLGDLGASARMVVATNGGGNKGWVLHDPSSSPSVARSGGAHTGRKAAVWMRKSLQGQHFELHRPWDWVLPDAERIGPGRRGPPGPSTAHKSWRKKELL